MVVENSDLAAGTVLYSTYTPPSLQRSKTASKSSPSISPTTTPGDRLSRIKSNAASASLYHHPSRRLTFSLPSFHQSLDRTSGVVGRVRLNIRQCDLPFPSPPPPPNKQIRVASTKPPSVHTSNNYTWEIEADTKGLYISHFIPRSAGITFAFSQSIVHVSPRFPGQGSLMRCLTLFSSELFVITFFPFPISTPSGPIGLFVRLARHTCSYL